MNRCHTYKSVRTKNSDRLWWAPGIKDRPSDHKRYWIGTTRQRFETTGSHHKSKPLYLRLCPCIPLDESPTRGRLTPTLGIAPFSPKGNGTYFTPRPPEGTSELVLKSSPTQCTRDSRSRYLFRSPLYRRLSTSCDVLLPRVNRPFDGRPFLRPPTDSTLLKGSGDVRVFGPLLTLRRPHPVRSVPFTGSSLVFPRSGWGSFGSSPVDPDTVTSSDPLHSSARVLIVRHPDLS